MANRNLVKRRKKKNEVDFRYLLRCCGRLSWFGLPEPRPGALTDCDRQWCGEPYLLKKYETEKKEEEEKKTTHTHEKKQAKSKKSVVERDYMGLKTNKMWKKRQWHIQNDFCQMNVLFIDKSST